MQTPVSNERRRASNVSETSGRGSSALLAASIVTALFILLSQWLVISEIRAHVVGTVVVSTVEF
jgi:hypothetical protein